MMWDYVGEECDCTSVYKHSLQKGCGTVGLVGHKKQYLYICKYISYQVCKLIYIFLYIQKNAQICPTVPHCTVNQLNKGFHSVGQHSHTVPQVPHTKEDK